MTVSTFFSDKHTETDTHDAYLAHDTDPTNNTWATFRGGAGTGASDNSTALIAKITHGDAGANWITFMRAQMLYDTSDIGTDEISAARWESVGIDKRDDFTISVSLVSSDPASNTAGVAGDYDAVGSTEFAVRVVSELTADSSAYQTWTLNTDGIAAISKTGITKLGLKVTEDLGNSEPGDSGVRYDHSQWKCFSADETEGGEARPRLVVTHASAFTPKAIMF